MKVPLFLKPNDNSEEADMARINLYQRAFHLTGGRGFRQPSTKKNGVPTRIERIAARHFAG